MSLINQMLQELEQRKAPPVALALPSNAPVQAVGVASPNRRLLPMTALVALLVVAFGWLRLPQPVNLGITTSFALPNANPNNNLVPVRVAPNVVMQNPPLQRRHQTEMDAPDATNSQLATVSASGRFTPVLDKNLPEIPKKNQKLKQRLSPTSSAVDAQVALTPTRLEQPLVPASAHALNPTLPLEPFEAKPVAHEKSVTQLALLSKPTDKPTVKKQLNSAQQASHDYHQAIAYLQQGRVAEAMDLLRQVLLAIPEHQDARQMLTGLLVDNQRHEEAMDVLQAGLNLSLAQPEYAQTLARLQLEAGQLSSALNTLATSLPYAKQQADYQALMAMVLQRLSRQQEAIFHYQQALSLGGQAPTWLVGLGVALQSEGRAEEAKLAFQQAQRGNLTPELAQFVDQRLKQVSQAN